MAPGGGGRRAGRAAVLSEHGDAGEASGLHDRAGDAEGCSMAAGSGAPLRAVSAGDCERDRFRGGTNQCLITTASKRSTWVLFCAGKLNPASIRCQSITPE